MVNFMLPAASKTVPSKSIGEQVTLQNWQPEQLFEEEEKKTMAPPVELETPDLPASMALHMQNMAQFS